MGKGDRYRPFSTTREERDLRQKYANSKMTFSQYQEKFLKLKREGLIRRDGRVIK